MDFRLAQFGHLCLPILEMSESKKVIVPKLHPLSGLVLELLLKNRIDIGPLVDSIIQKLCIVIESIYHRCTILRDLPKPISPVSILLGWETTTHRDHHDGCPSTQFASQLNFRLWNIFEQRLMMIEIDFGARFWSKKSMVTVLAND